MSSRVSNEMETINGVNGTVNGTDKQKSPSSHEISDEEKNRSPNDSFERFDPDDIVKSCTFPKLIELMRDFQYDSTSSHGFGIITTCKMLFEKDYKVKIVQNCLNSRYPKEIIIPLGEKGSSDLMEFDEKTYIQLVKDSLIARIRCRFVAPAMLFDNKFICRSGTLTVWASALYEKFKKEMPNYDSFVELVPSIPPLKSIANYPMSALSRVISSLPSWGSVAKTAGSCVSAVSAAISNPVSTTSNALYELKVTAYEYSKLLTFKVDLDVLYANDIKVLDYLKVERICDLMVEYNKHYRGAVNVSATERVSNLYVNFKMEELPYPGCEFFTEYSESRNPNGLVFDWNQSDATRTMNPTENLGQLFPDMDTSKFKQWDLVTLTQNYLKIIVSSLALETGGIVVHCISGWDRTPLFVSLIRLSLWADGVVHQSLSKEDIAYLTVAYDWYLFGHNLPDRLKKDEEVMHFCFNFLPYITSDDFSVTKMFSELPAEKKANRNFPEFQPGKRKVLNEISSYVLESYDEFISRSEKK